MSSQLDFAALEDCLKSLNHLFINFNRLKAEAGYETKRGGYGDVQVMRLDPGTASSKLIAAKTIYLRAPRKQSERLAFRLARELKVWARLHHPHVLPVLGYYLDQDYRSAVLMSEYMIHGDLRDYIEQEKPSWDARLYLTRDATAGLAYLHGQDPPILHGDLKTGNVLINAERRAILADFGLSRAMEEGPTGLTTSNGLKGTLRYYSPELIRETDACHSLPSDIWAWACLALEVLADVIPYAEMKSEHSIIRALMSNEPPSDTISLPIPVPAVKHLLDRCWTVQPNERPSADHCLSIIAAELPALQMTSVVGGNSHQRSNLRSFNFDEDYSSNRQLDTPKEGNSAHSASPFTLHLTSLNGQSIHNRTISGTSTSAFAHLTTPADLPPDHALGAGTPTSSSHFNGLSAGHQSAFKARSALYTQRRRSRPYDALPHGHHSLGGRTGRGGAPDEYPGFPSTAQPSSRPSSPCSDAGQDDISSLSMFQPSSSSYNSHHLQGAAAALGGQQPDYSVLFATPLPAHHQHAVGAVDDVGDRRADLGECHTLAVGLSSAGGLSAPLDPAAASGGMGQGLSAEARLEQLAANVRSSTTTTASDHAKQVFVQAWLSTNYAPYPIGNVHRQGLYNSYRRVCDAYNIPHINTTTLGKAVRLCFPNMKTRRLGVRGNTKYYYCGIRLATAAETEFLQGRTTNHAAIAASSRRGAAAVAAAQAAAQGENGSDEDDNDSEVLSSDAGGLADSESSSVHPTTLGLGDTLGGGPKSPTLYSMLGDDKTPTTNTLLSAHQAASLNGRTANNGLTYGMSHADIGSTDSQVFASDAVSGSRLGTNSGFAAGSTASVSVKSLPNFPSINEALGIDSKPPANDGSAGDSNASASSPSSQNSGSFPHRQAAIEVWAWLEDHLDGLLKSVRGWRFDHFEIRMRTFWASLRGDYREVVHAPAVAGLVVRADAVVYGEILEILRTQLFATIPPHSLASLRQLAEKMERILQLALEGYGTTFVEPKVELGARFSRLVLRFLDMGRLTRALTPVLSNAHHLSNMRRAWSEVNFELVRNWSALVCNCRREALSQLLEFNFVAVLDGLVANAQLGGLVGSSEPVRDIMNWTDLCCEWLMDRASGSADGEEKFTLSSRSVLIQWGYVTSQVMRDLTIRRDPSFGAFQILKLFLEDCIALNVRFRSVVLSTNLATQQGASPTQGVRHHPLANSTTFDVPRSRPGTSSGCAAGSMAPVRVKSLPNFPSINEALGIDSKPQANADGSAGDSNASGGSSSSQNGGGSPHHQAAIEAWRWFEDHLDGLLESVRGWRFDQFEIHVRTFWATLSGDYREVVHAPAVEILEILRTQLLATIPPHSLASLRQIAEKMEKILLLALEGYGNTFVEPKVELGARFGHLVLRFLDMYQVTQALTSVLSNPQQVADMRRAWSEVDFELVRDWSALVCNFRHEDLQQLLEVNFVAVLDGLVANAQLGALVGSSGPVRDIMNWADVCCERLMGRTSGGADGEEKFTLSSRSVLIQWGYVTSQVMRDLTTRSDPSFGAFQILRLFLDDWIALNVRLRSVALSTNSATQKGASSTQGGRHHPLASSTTLDAPFSYGTAEQAHSTAATGVNGSEAGESSVPGRRGSDESVDVKNL